MFRGGGVNRARIGKQQELSREPELKIYIQNPGMLQSHTQSRTIIKLNVVLMLWIIIKSVIQFHAQATVGQRLCSLPS